MQLRARSALANGLAGILLEARDRPGAAQQIEVMRQSGGIARVLKLSEHLCIREHLAGIAATQLEQPSQKGRLVYPGHQEDIAGDGGLDQRIEQVAPPALRVFDE